MKLDKLKYHSCDQERQVCVMRFFHETLHTKPIFNKAKHMKATLLR